MNNKFPVLQVIVWIFRVLGILVLVVGLVAGIAGLFGGLFGGFARGFGMMQRYPFGGMMGNGIFVFLYALLSGIFLYGAGEVIALLLAIETNTRANRMALEEKPKPAAEPPAGQG